MDTENGTTTILEMPFKPFQLWMMVGFPGSGKSTLIHKNFMNGPHANKMGIISSDDVIERIAKERGLTYNDVFKEVVEEAHKEMDAKLIEYVQSGKEVIFWDQTNLSKKVRSKKLDQFNAIPGSGLYSTGIAYLDTPFELCLERIKNRPGKNIPIAIMESMKKSFEIPDDTEGFHEVWHLDHKSL